MYLGANECEPVRWGSHDKATEITGDRCRKIPPLDRQRKLFLLSHIGSLGNFCIWTILQILGIFGAERTGLVHFGDSATEPWLRNGVHLDRADSDKLHLMRETSLSGEL